jgi:hypothetical protein
MPIQPGTTTQPDLDDLADLDALTDELNRLGYPSLRLAPPGKAPYVDVSPPDDMTPGERIYIQAGTFFWHGARPIAPSNQPTTAAAIITNTLRPATQQA